MYLVLFNGCPLRCQWCSIPESQEAQPEIAAYPDKCIDCGLCVPVCRPRALRLSDSAIRIDRSLCDSCGRCAEVCNSEAFRVLGQPMTVEDLVEEVKKDAIFCRRSGCGVITSGGEPLLDCDFAVELLRALKEEA